MVAGKSSEGNSEVLGHVVWWCVQLLRSLLFVIYDVILAWWCVKTISVCALLHCPARRGCSSCLDHVYIFFPFMGI
jgi:hypothetical protein